MMGLTHKQNRLYELLCVNQHRGHVSLSYSEIAPLIGVTSKSAVHRAVIALEDRGYVRRMPGRARAIMITGVSPLCPHCGEVSSSAACLENAQRTRDPRAARAVAFAGTG